MLDDLDHAHCRASRVKLLADQFAILLGHPRKQAHLRKAPAAATGQKVSHSRSKGKLKVLHGAYTLCVPRRARPLLIASGPSPPWCIAGGFIALRGSAAVLVGVCRDLFLGPTIPPWVLLFSPYLKGYFRSMPHFEPSANQEQWGSPLLEGLVSIITGRPCVPLAGNYRARI